jgi:formylmethanofuran dehydrogenase subunit B
VSDAFVSCPFCGLLCDDLQVAVVDGRAQIASAGCARAVRLFDAPLRGQALVAGKPVDLSKIGRAHV